VKRGGSKLQSVQSVPLKKILTKLKSARLSAATLAELVAGEFEELTR
jgi:hypothetical protein